MTYNTQPTSAEAPLQTQESVNKWSNVAAIVTAAGGAGLVTASQAGLLDQKWVAIANIVWPNLGAIAALFLMGKGKK